jgi:hypothetical protein
MANALSAQEQEMWEAETQALLEERSIFMDIATMRDAVGKAIIHNPYNVRPQSETYTKYNDVNIKPLIAVADNMDTFTSRIVTFDYDPVDALDTEYNTVADAKEDCAYQLSMDMERAFFEEYSNAQFASSAAVTLDSSNTLLTFANAKATLTNNGADDRDMITVVDDFVHASIANYVTTNGYNEADGAIRRGYKWEFVGSRLYSSSSLIAEASLTPAINFVADTTVTINGVVFTAKATPAAAWEFDIGASTAASIDNLVAAINNANGYAAGEWLATTYFEVSAEDRDLLNGVVATDGTTTVDIETRGYRALSSSIAKWGAVSLNTLVMQRGAIDFALRSPVKLDSQPIPKQLGTRYLTWVNYGKKTFTQNKKRMYNVKIVAQAAEV